MKAALFLLIFLLSKNLNVSLGIRCYRCANANGNSCGNKFNPQGNGVTQVNSTSNYCWVCLCLCSYLIIEMFS